jgi:Sulfotransferase domain
VSGGGLRVVGAGLGRTGTNSLKLALERLLGGPCYHMLELIGRPHDTPVWHAAVRGEPPDWASFLAGFRATVDWPACAFWPELADANPDAIVLLSTRADGEAWWRSFSSTIAAGMSRPVPPDRPDWRLRREMNLEMLTTTLTPDWSDRDAAVAAYERHNAAVRSAVPARRLVEWRPGDGWEPLCAALGVPVPSEPFPRTNSAAEFRSQHLAPEPSESLPG